MKGYATLFLSIGVILSLMSIGIAAGHGAGGWIIAIIIMALYWVIIPKYLIYSLERAASAQLWGVGSGKIGKQYKCNKCGHMW